MLKYICCGRLWDFKRVLRREIRRKYVFSCTLWVNISTPPYFRSGLSEKERELCVKQEEACLYGWELQTSWYDIALREDEGWSMRRIEINAINADIQNAPAGAERRL